MTPEAEPSAARGGGAPAAPRLHAQGPRIELLGVPVDVVDLDGAVERVAALAAAPGLAQVATANVDFLAQASRQASMRRLLTSCDLVVADGVPLLWMARWSGTPLPGRVNGTDLVHRLLADAAGRRWTVAFLGGEPGVAERAAAEAAGRWGTPVAGVWPLSPEEVADPDASAAVAAEVGAARADLVLVALGGGRQERWIDAHRHLLGAGVAVGVGSALDFVAGSRRRAPLALQRRGLEWAWRLALEPGRLWRRYLVTDLALLVRFALRRLT